MRERVDYGWDAPYVSLNLLLVGVVCLGASFAFPRALRLGHVLVDLRTSLWITTAFCFAEVLLFWHYVKRGKFRHRDFILRQRMWRGNERVLDVGCGRGLLLAGVAKQAPQGQATGLDVWSKKDLSGNSEEATLRNLRCEELADRCTLVSAPAQAMPFADGSFDVVVSNLCLHNIYDRATRQTAVEEIARVLRPGGQALLSDYKLTAEYAGQLRGLGFTVRRCRGNLVDCFPPMRVVIAEKPTESL